MTTQYSFKDHWEESVEYLPIIEMSEKRKAAKKGSFITTPREGMP